MEKEPGKRLILHSPNIVALCVDSYSAQRQDGRLYHQYTDRPLRFESLITALEEMDRFYDDLQFPFASTETRSFFVAARQGSRRLEEAGGYRSSQNTGERI